MGSGGFTVVDPGGNWLRISANAGLRRHPDAPTADRVQVLAYLVELAARTGDHERTAAVLAELRGHELDPETAAAVAETAAALDGAVPGT